MSRVPSTSSASGRSRGDAHSQYDGQSHDGYANDDTLFDDSQISIYNFLDQLQLLNYYPLFSGYESITSLCVLREADFVRIGIKNATHRRRILARLEEEFGAPSSQQKATMTRSASQHSVVVPPVLQPKKKKGILGRLPLKATERHGLTTDSEAPAPRKSPRPSLDPTAVVEVLQDPSALLQHQPWFHGKISRKVAEAAVRTDGDILLRESTSKPGQYVLTTRWTGRPMHFVVDTVFRAATLKSSKTDTLRRRLSSSRSSVNVISEKDGGELRFRFGGDSFPSIVELVNHHLRTKQPISDAKGPVAAFAVPRHITASESRSSLTGSLSGSRRNSFRLDELDQLSLIDIPMQSNGDGSLKRMSPDRGSVGALSLPATRTGGDSPPLKSKTSFSSMIRGKSPLRLRRPPSTISDAGLSGSVGNVFKERLGTSSTSLHKTPSVDSLLNPDMPDRALLRAVCNEVLSNGAQELARHMARVNLQVAHVLLPKEVAPADSSYLPFMNGSAVKLSDSEMMCVLKQQASWQAGEVSGISNVLLHQGAGLAQALLDRFESLSLWTATVVMGAGDLKARCTALKRMVEIAQCLQSDAVADLFGFLAVMRGLRRPEVQRLEATWNEFRLRDSKIAILYDSQLCGLEHSLRHGTNTHLHIPVSLPTLQPLLELVTEPMVALNPDDLSPPAHSWFHEDDDIASLDALVSHLDQGREISVQSTEYSLAAATRLRQLPVSKSLEEYFKRDFPWLLLMSRPGLPSSPDSDGHLVSVMLDAMSEAAEASHVIGRNTSI